MPNAAKAPNGEPLDAVLVGAGPCGLAVASAFHEAGLRYAHLEHGRVAETVRHFAAGVRLFSTRRELQIPGVGFAPGDHPSPTREEYLAYLDGVVWRQQLPIHTHTSVERLTPGDRGHVVEVRAADGGRRTLRARNVVVASGGYFRPKLLDIPGEDQDNVSHYFDGPEAHCNKRLLVVGGKNSAVEAATLLVECGNRVTLAYRGARLSRTKVKPWLLPRFDQARRDGQLRLLYRTTPTEIAGSRVRLQGPKGEGQTDVDRIYLLTGYGPDYALLRQAGVPLHRQTARPLFNRHTLETKVDGIFLAGTVVLRWRGQQASIPNTREHGELLLDSLRS